MIRMLKIKCGELTYINTDCLLVMQMDTSFISISLKKHSKLNVRCVRQNRRIKMYTSSRFTTRSIPINVHENTCKMENVESMK